MARSKESPAPRNKEQVLKESPLPPKLILEAICNYSG